MILYLDHHDSFSDIFCDYCRQLGHEVMVIKTSEVTLKHFHEIDFSHLILGAGPGHPGEASLEGVRQFIEAMHVNKPLVPVLGVCLGHQLLAQYFGARVVPAKRLFHGRLSMITCDTLDSLFAHHPRQFKVCRYHSLLIEPTSLPACLRVIAATEAGEIMAIRHVTRPYWGIQYHPEAFLSEQGLETIACFLG